MFCLCQIKLNSNSGGGGPTRKTEDNSFKVAGVKLIRNAVVTAKPYVYDEHEIGFFFYFIIIFAESVPLFAQTLLLGIFREKVLVKSKNTRRL